MSKPTYRNLTEFLEKTPLSVQSLTLSFAQIEMLTGPFPASAREYRAWWGNERSYSSRPQARAWMSAYFDAVKVDTAAEVVTFRRNFIKLHKTPTTYSKHGRDEWDEDFESSIYLYDVRSRELIEQRIRGRDNARDPRANFEGIAETRKIAADELPEEAMARFKKLEHENGMSLPAGS